MPSPLVGSLLKGTIIVFESPSCWVVELLSEGLLSGNVSIGLGSEDWVGVVFVLHGGLVLGESGRDVNVELGLVLLDEWAVNWVGGESHVVLGNLLELLINGSSLGCGHSNRPELLWSSSSGESTSGVVGVNVVLKILHSLGDLVVNVLELGIVSSGITSVDEVLEVGLGSLVISSIGCLLSLSPLLEVWNHIVFHELSGILTGVNELVLNVLSNVTINEVSGGNGSGQCNKGGEFHIFWFNF